MINNKLISNFNNSRNNLFSNFDKSLSSNCNLLKKIPIWIYIIFGIILIYLLYKFFNLDNNQEIIENNDFIKSDLIFNKCGLESSDIINKDFQPNLIIYNFNTKWCHWSKNFRPEWEKFMDTIKKIKIENPNFNVVAIDVDCDDSKNKELINKYDIPGYPYILIESKDGKRYEYENKRTSDELLRTVNEMLSNVF
jgi:hypothetical protein